MNHKLKFEKLEQIHLNLTPKSRIQLIKYIKIHYIDEEWKFTIQI